jgi:hypothetical protein
MKSSRRWRDWVPPEKLRECSENELTKLTKPLQGPLLSVLAVPIVDKVKTITPTSSRLSHDPEAWRRPFARWLRSACLRSTCCSLGVRCLLSAYSEWEIRQGGVPCTRATFELLLREMGFQIEEVVGVVLVSGLAFREHWPVEREELAEGG